jgi:endonuclease/exonuclease/phosphatase family metal-dependent hydrolase
MKICTYNIHRAIGIERVAKPQRIVEVLQEIDADIIAQQEASFLHDSHHDLVKLLAAELHAEAQFKILIGDLNEWLRWEGL